ncbi:PAS domain S-box-containing protein [Pedobacter sp. AK017]|uniref:ATP-binding protein n=1 Tax=Pedobacter sp. AK017 TaxID=2723073 RepID=UPI00160D292C|nr:ATP-binding protein [Pedobacter sp. AK017]MBB5440014.1 PAS domain S-box-containing protein [Pedobacter sp. AK017]
MNNTSIADKKLAEIQKILEISPMGAFQADTVGNCLFLNRQWENISGLSVEESLGKGWMSIVYEDDIVLINNLLKDVMAEGKEIFDFVYRIHHPSEGLRQLKVNAKFIFDDYGVISYYIGFLEDITDRTQSELAFQEIKQNLERSNLILDVSQELSTTGGWEFNLLTGEVFWTKQVYEINGVDEQTFVPTFEGVLSRYEEGYAQIMEQQVKEAIEKQIPYDLELRLCTPAGVRKWVRAVGTPIVADNKVVVLRGAITDITQKKEIELELLRAKDIAEHSAKAKTDFLSVMSHEIRTPLNGIIGIANLLKLKHTMDQEEYVRSLIFSADHLLQLINDILDLTKIESDKLELVLAEVNIFELVRNIKNQFKSLAEAKGIVVKSFIDDDIPQRLIADPVRLGQILNNLISNAIKFTESGAVTITLSLVALTANKANVHFSVKDTGMGIPEELHETIFESFKQVQQDVHRKHTGTGLGLAITQKLVELHDGRILLKSTAGQGTEFYFELNFDLATDENSPGTFRPGPEITVYEGRLKGLRILFVEDNPINVMVAKNQLEYFGSVPDCAYNGKEALALLNDNQYDVALLDLHMPEIDGYALADLIQQQYPGIHIVIFTADIMTEVKLKLAKMHIFDILNKPFSPERMFEVLYNVAKNRGVLI